MKMIYLYLEFKTKSKLLGAILLPIALLINGFANLTLSADMQKSSPLVPSSFRGIAFYYQKVNLLLKKLHILPLYNVTYYNFLINSYDKEL